MMYLSRGELTQSAKTGLDYVSRCGCAYALGRSWLDSGKG